MAEPRTISNANDSYIFVAGGTGGIGAHIVRNFLQHKRNVRLMARDPEQAKAKFASYLEKQDGGDYGRLDIVKGDVTDHASVNRAVQMEGNIAVVSSLGVSKLFTDSAEKIEWLGTKALIDAAKASGIDKFTMISSVSVTKWYSIINLIGLGKLKLKAENHLRESGLYHAIVRPPRLYNDNNGSEHLKIRQGDGLEFVGPSISRLDAAYAATFATEYLLSQPRPNNSNGFTFEVKQVSSVPKKEEEGSWFVSKPSSPTGWNKMFPELVPDN